MRKLNGQRFGRLLVISSFRQEEEGKRRARTFCKCLCNCGKEATVLSSNLIAGKTRSGGCGKTKNNTLNGNPINSRTFVKEYNAWNHMKHRCLDPKTDGYERYGGRGITVCEEWENSFEAFLLDMGQAPSPDHQLDRIDKDGNYEPENCKWRTAKEQANNRRSSRFITYNRETLTLDQWASKLEIPVSTLKTRWYSGVTIDDVFAPAAI